MGAAHTGDGRWYHGSWLVGPGIAVVSGAPTALDPTPAARASLACAQAPDGTMVWRPRLAILLANSYRVYSERCEGRCTSSRAWHPIDPGHKSSKVHCHGDQQMLKMGFRWPHVPRSS